LSLNKVQTATGCLVSAFPFTENAKDVQSLMFWQKKLFAYCKIIYFYKPDLYLSIYRPRTFFFCI